MLRPDRKKIKNKNIILGRTMTRNCSKSRKIKKLRTFFPAKNQEKSAVFKLNLSFEQNVCTSHIKIKLLLVI